ncbi:glutamyl-tRNA reductase [Mangrovitalea sediminis]|uniref:glutamyl-tRNA reductase n=1 Tax=Mangrovitalea sediminis TaxID=1982043 RepID=UPI000BE5F6E8|nr:glutamyl-tRNA reductase [Mangrovitalea sediminis]
MAVLVLGINHRTAPVEMRECVAFAPETLPSALRQVVDTKRVSEVAILSTCNRTEVYCATDLDGERQLLDWLGGFHSIDALELAGCCYVYWQDEAVRHMMRVASGLDSMVLGEPQILGQLKDAYASAREAGTVGRELTRLFEQSFSIAKRVRTQTSIGENPVSVAYAAVAMSRHIFSDLSENRALLIGAGKTIRLVAQHLRELGLIDITVANRTLERAEELAAEMGGQGIRLSDIPEVLPNADIIISSTGSPLPILGKGSVERALKQRKHRPMFMVDIAVPRDIEPEVRELSDVYLYTVDDLREVIEENIRSREGAAREAENLIESGVSEFMYQLRALDAVATLKQFRGQAERVRDDEVDKAVRALQAGADAETIVRSMARALTNKLLHGPTVQVRKATAEGRADVAEWLRELYDLSPGRPNGKGGNADGNAAVEPIFVAEQRQKV